MLLRSVRRLGDAGIVQLPMQGCADLHVLAVHRVQVQTMMKGSYNYSSAWHAISSIVRQRGLRGMLKGYWAGNSVRCQSLVSKQYA